MDRHSEFTRLVARIDARVRNSSNGGRRDDKGQMPSWVKGGARMVLWYLGNSNPPQFDASFGPDVHMHATATPHVGDAEQFRITLLGDEWSDGTQTYTTQDLTNALLMRLAAAADGF